MSEVEAARGRQIADEILSLPTDEARSRRLEARRASFSPELARALRRTASQQLRAAPQEGLSAARLAERVSTALEDWEGVHVALRLQARAQLLLGRHPEALGLLDRAGALGRRAGIETGLAEADVLRVDILTHAERYAEARETARGVLEAALLAGRREIVLRCHLALADLAWRQDRPREALRHHREAERHLPDPVPPRMAAVMAGNRANALVMANRFRAAVRQHARARQLFETEGCTHTVAQVDCNAAWVDTLLGRFQEALCKLARAEQVFLQARDDHKLALISLDRAEIYLRLHHVEDALHFAREARVRFEALGLKKEHGQALVVVARAAARARRDDEALEAWRAAAATFAEVGLAAREVDALAQGARAAFDRDERETAGRLLARARAAAGDDVHPTSRATLDLLDAQMALGAPAPDLDRSRRLLTGVRSHLRRVHAPALEIDAWHLEGRVRRAAGDLGGAIAAYRRAVDLLDRFREGVPPDEYMTTFLGANAGLYEEIVDVLLAAGDVELAFEYCERAKSRSLADLLDRPAASWEADLGPSVRRARFLRERLHGMYRALGHLPSERSGATTFERRARGETRECERELARCLRQLQVGRSRATSSPANVPSREAIGRTLGPDTVLLEYFLTDRWLAVFAITEDGVRALRWPVERTAIRLHVERFHFHLSQLQRPHAPSPELLLRATRANLASLTGLLVAPVATHLRRRVVIVPHGDLHHVPFHALPWGAGWVADRHEVVYAPSSTVYVACGRREPTSRRRAFVFGLADETVPQIEREVRAVARHLGTADVFEGAAATWPALERAAGEARLLHVATHGMYRHATPSLSGIQLADRWVTAFDLYDLPLDGAFVVLSACESRTVDARLGDEAEGITRGFLAAGAGALLTAQWRLRDDVTAAFMDAFYEVLAVAGDPVASYMEAMRRVREAHPHPYHWAPFFLTGQPAPIPVSRPAALHAARDTALCTSSRRESER